MNGDEQGFHWIGGWVDLWGKRGSGAGTGRIWAFRGSCLSHRAGAAGAAPGGELCIELRSAARGARRVFLTTDGTDEEEKGMGEMGLLQGLNGSADSGFRNGAEGAGGIAAVAPQLDPAQTIGICRNGQGA